MVRGWVVAVLPGVGLSWYLTEVGFAGRAGSRMMRGLVRCVAAAAVLAAGVVVTVPQALAVPVAGPATAGGPAGAAAACSPALRGVSLSPSSVPGGAASTVTVTVSCAPRQALAVSLSGFSGVRVPSSVRVEAGKVTAAGVIMTATRKAATHGTITAALGKARVTARLTVRVTPKTCKDPVLSAVSLPGLAYVGDRPGLGVKLSCVSATATRLVLKSTRGSLPVPGAAVIGAYYGSGTFSLAPQASPAGQYTATVSVRYGGRTLSRAITVDPGLSKFVLVPGGADPDLVLPDVTLTGPAPAGGLTVKVASGNPVVTVPATARYAQGSTGGEFKVTKVADVTGDTKVTLSVSLGSTTLTASITLLPPWKPADGFTVVPFGWSGQVYGGSASEAAMLSLGDPLDPEGPAVTGKVSVTGPGIIIPYSGFTGVAPGSDGEVIQFSARDVSVPTTTDLTATFDGVTESLPVKVEPGPWRFTVPAMMGSGDSARATITLYGPPDVPTTVRLQSPGPSFTVTPASLTIPAGRTSATFTITALPVTSSTHNWIFASVGGAGLYSALIDITP
jgi:hypothetical protein